MHCAVPVVSEEGLCGGNRGIDFNFHLIIGESQLVHRTYGHQTTLYHIISMAQWGYENINGRIPTMYRYHVWLLEIN